MTVPFVDTGAYPARPGNAIVPWIDGEPAFRRIAEAIEHARASVWVTVTFLWAEFVMPDGRGGALDVLERAARRGVDVRLLCWRPDDETDAWRPNAFWGSDAHRARLAAHHPTLSVLWDRAHPGYCQHQKVWLVDGCGDDGRAFIGSSNLNPYSLVTPAHRGALDNHEVGVEVSGPSVADVHHNFVQRWNEASERTRADGWHGPRGQEPLAFRTTTPAARGEAVVQVQRTTHAGRYADRHPAPGAAAYPVERGEHTILDQYCIAIAAARRTIYLEQQYVAVPEVLTALEAALSRGVRIVVMQPAGSLPPQVTGAPGRGQHAAPPPSRLALHPHLTWCAMACPGSDGARHPVHVHSKLMLVDDAWATVGSANLHHHSAWGNGELNAAFHHAPTVRAMRVALFREHLGVDTAHMDDDTALRCFTAVAAENRDRHSRGETTWRGMAIRLDGGAAGA